MEYSIIVFGGSFSQMEAHSYLSIIGKSHSHKYLMKLDILYEAASAMGCYVQSWYDIGIITAKDRLENYT